MIREQFDLGIPMGKFSNTIIWAMLTTVIFADRARERCFLAPWKI